MTQYQRITGKVFGGNATATGNDPQIAQFGSALANTFVGTTDPSTIQQLPAWGQGWIGAVTPETQFPPLPEMTGAMKVLSHQICGILQQGVSTWDNGTIYYTGNFVSLNGRLYISQVDENQGNNPATDTTNWQDFLSDIEEKLATIISDNSSLIASYSALSNEYIDLTLGASEAEYIAPANGYYYINKQATSGQNIRYDIFDENDDFICEHKNWCSNNEGNIAFVSPQIQKGQKVTITYDASGTTYQFRFVYAQGSESEAN